MPAKGTFLLDIEVELAWGMLDLGTGESEMVDICQRARSHLEEIFELLDKYNIPVTWDILGHLLMHRNQTVSPTLITDTTQAQDRNLSNEPAFYGKDVVDKILKYAARTEVLNDVGCHSFSHQLFGESNLSPTTAETEVKRCVSVFEETYGITPRVFVFPKNDVGHLEVLRENGFVAFRGPIPQLVNYSETARSFGNSIRKYASLIEQFASFYLIAPPPVVDPMEENGLINIPASMCYNKKPFIPLGLVVKKTIKGIDRAVQRRRIFHLFTHEVNFGQMKDATEFIEGFEKILAHASLNREKNVLEITTMKRVAEGYFSKG